MDINILSIAAKFNSFLAQNIYSIAGAGACAYSIGKLYNFEKKQVKNTWKKIMQENNLVNEDNKTFNIVKITKTNYGYLMIVGIPIGYSYEQLEKIKEKIECSLKCLVEMEFNKLKGWIRVKLITKPFEEKEFRPIPLQPYELLIGHNHLSHVIINMNSAPHILITGVTGSGKNCALEIQISNLIANHSKDKVQFYLTQLMKKELIYFRRYENIIKMAFNLNEAVEMFKEIEQIIKERTDLIFSYAEQGVKNIKQFNDKFPNKQLSYIYVVIDEYAFYMPEKADSKDEKLQKAYCLSVIKKILLDGRALGIFGIILVQRPDSESITGLFKSQVNNILCFKQSNEISSRIAIDIPDAANLNMRGAILKTNTYQTIRTPFISDEIIRTSLKHREVKKNTIGNVSEAKLENFKIVEITKEQYKQIKLESNEIKDGFIKKGGNKK